MLEIQKVQNDRNIKNAGIFNFMFQNDKISTNVKISMWKFSK